MSDSVKGEPTEAAWLEGNDPITTRERFEEATTNGYTPTTDEVREAISEWAWSRRMWRADLGASDGQEADRWLAERIAQAKAEALDEFARKLSGEYTLNFASADALHDQIVRLLKRDAGIIREAVQS